MKLGTVHGRYAGLYTTPHPAVHYIPLAMHVRDVGEEDPAFVSAPWHSHEPRLGMRSGQLYFIVVL